MPSGLAAASLLALALLAPALPASDTVAPRRVVSINLCSDLLLLSLVSRERIVSLSPYAAEATMSPLAARAEGIPVNYARVEEVIEMAPDLVLAGRFNAPETIILLQRLHVPLLVLEVPNSVAESRAQIRQVAAALGERQRAETLIAEMDRRLTLAAGDASGAWPLAAVYRANGYTAGAGTLVDDLLAAANLSNLATEVGVRGWGTIDLEALLLGRPRLLVLDSGDDQPSLATAILDHPALQRLAARVPVVHMPARLWNCAGPWMADAVERLAAARRALGAP